MKMAIVSKKALVEDSDTEINALKKAAQQAAREVIIPNPLFFYDLFRFWLVLIKSNYLPELERCYRIL